MDQREKSLSTDVSVIIFDADEEEYDSTNKVTQNLWCKKR